MTVLFYTLHKSSEVWGNYSVKMGFQLHFPPWNVCWVVNVLWLADALQIPLWLTTYVRHLILAATTNRGQLLMRSALLQVPL
jgi:hypothetical protein